MRSIRLGKTELQVSALSLGTWSHGGPNQVGTRPVGWSGFDEETALESLRAAHRVGIRHWDTADVYGSGRSESLIGNVLKDIPREEIVLASKVGWDPGPYEHFYEGKWVRNQVESSLKRLGVDHMDLYYMHHCLFGPNDERLDEVMELMHRFKDEGKIRFIGLSDWDATAIARVIDRVEPDVVQPYRCMLYDSLSHTPLREAVDRLDAGLAFFSPLRHGLLLGKYEEATTFEEGDFRSNVEGFTDEELLKAMRQRARQIQERLGQGIPPVIRALTGTLLEDAPTACALVGLRNVRQVEMAVEASESLSAADAAWVRELYADCPGKTVPGGDQP